MNIKLAMCVEFIISVKLDMLQGTLKTYAIVLLMEQSQRILKNINALRCDIFCGHNAF